MQLDTQTIWSRVQSALAWPPDWLVGVVILLAAALLALLVHWLAIGIARRVVGTRRVFLDSLMVRTSAPTRLALVVFALSAALPAAPFEPAVRETIAHALLVVFILLVGWFAMIAVHLAAAVYLRRFHVESEDNWLARQHVTQVRILQRATDTLVIVITFAAALMTFDAVRQYGVSLFASAGVVGIVVGLAARPVLSNLIAGVQIAMTQPIRLEDAVIVENEFGWIEEIAAAYVVIRLWDQRRMVVPLSYFIEKPFQNWTRQSGELIGSVMVYVDYSAPVGRIRDKLNEIASQSSLWDRRVVNLQVNDATETTMKLRALVSAGNAGALADLRAEVREKLIAFLQQEYPQCLPKHRAEVDWAPRVAIAQAGRSEDGTKREVPPPRLAGE
jgi:small-conductance mechanosensitive channel